MTLKHSFLRLLREDMKRRKGNLILCVYATVFGMIGMRFLPDWEFSMRSGFVGPGNGPLFIMNALWALLLGTGGFSWLFSGKKADFFLSAPVCRKKLFLASWLNGFLQFFLMNALCRTVLYKMAVWSGRKGELGEEAISVSITALGILLSTITFLFLYHLVIICCVLTGNGLVCLGLITVVAGYGELWLKGVVPNYNRLFFQSFYRSPFLEKLAGFLSPVRLCGNLLGAISWEFMYEDDILGNWLIQNHWTFLNAALLLTVITFIAAYFLFAGRAAEKAETALAFDGAGPVLGLLLEIHESFHRTLDFLERRGIPADKTIKDYPMKKAEVIRYDENGKRTGKGEVISGSRLKAIKERLLPCELYRNELLNPVERNVVVKVRYRNGEAQTADIVECYLTNPEDETPEAQK